MIKLETTEKQADFDLSHPKARWKELLMSAKILGDVAYPRLKAGLDWKGKDMEYVEKSFASIFNVLRKECKFALVPPTTNKEGYNSSLWKLYRRAQRKGLITVQAPIRKEDINKWNEEKEKIIKTIVSKTLFALDNNGNIADQFVSAPKFAFYEDEELKHELTNDISEPRPLKLLKICKKLKVNKVVAKEFGDDICDLFKQKGVELVCGAGKPFATEDEFAIEGEIPVEGKVSDDLTLENLIKAMDTFEKTFGVRPSSLAVSQEIYDRLTPQSNFEQISDIIKIEVVSDTSEVKLMSNVRKTEKRSLRDMIGKPFKIIRKLRRNK